jgi:hypothetical protein
MAMGAADRRSLPKSFKGFGSAADGLSATRNTTLQSLPGGRLVSASSRLTDSSEKDVRIYREVDLGDQSSENRFSCFASREDILSPRVLVLTGARAIDARQRGVCGRGRS